MSFSPSNQYLISLGDIYDRGLFLWNWKNSDNPRLTSNKLGKPVYQLKFNSDPFNEYFITFGFDHLKYWYLSEELSSGRIT